MAAPTGPKGKRRKKPVLKRIRQTGQRTAVNRLNKTILRRQIKNFRRALAAGNRPETEKLLRPTISLIDRAIQKGILHKNTANRYKSRLMLRYTTLQSAGAAG